MNFIVSNSKIGDHEHSKVSNKMNSIASSNQFNHFKGLSMVLIRAIFGEYQEQLPKCCFSAME